MKANELRIGNYILAEGKEVKVNYLTPVSIGYGYGNFAPTFILDFFKPIPITEEWLLKFGFVKLSTMFEFWEGSVFNIELIENHWYVSYLSNVLCTHIKHVHQLQNLFFALTNKELEIQK